MSVEHAHPRFSASKAWELNNPLKRLFDHTPQYFIKLLGVEPDWAVVDFGCGPGFFTIPFAKAAGRVVGVDVQKEMLGKAENYARKAGVKAEFVESDGTRIPLPDTSFDLIFLNLVYHEIQEKKTALAEFWRILNSGGRLAIREKIENTLLPLGPPILSIEMIESDMKDLGFVEAQSLGRKGRRIVLWTKPS
jgi:ubiquinone/menaquinone biosynthesis C-methylase UbiE